MPRLHLTILTYLVCKNCFSIYKTKISCLQYMKQAFYNLFTNKILLEFDKTKILFTSFLFGTWLLNLHV